MPPKSDKRKKTMRLGQNSDRDQREARPRIRREQGERRKSRKEGHAVKEQEEEHDERTCVLCCETIDIFAKGSCDHTVCFKCSSRMRVLCEEKYCAVCRLDLKQVIFIEKNVPFAEVSINNMPSKPKYGIFFENCEIEKSFKNLLWYICPVCKERCSSFDDLRRHVRHKHEKQYCDICVRNLKIFPFEFRVYTRSEIVTHRKSGDSDNRSYKGHPQCEFCNERYFDNDELLLHLRKNHFWCHFCEKDGKQEYYENYEDLRSHFRNEHYLCEESECLHEKYTSVFRSDIDFQAHKLARHSKKLTKLAAKQARQLNVEIDYGTRKSRKQHMYDDRQLRERQEVDSKRVPASAHAAEKNSSSQSRERDQNASKGATASELSKENGTLNSPDSQVLNPQAVPFVPSEVTAVEEGPNKQKSRTMAEIAKPLKKIDNSKAILTDQKRTQPAKPKTYDAAFPPLGDQNLGGARPKTGSPKGRHEEKRKALNMADLKANSEHQKTKASKNSTAKVSMKTEEKAKSPPGMGKDNSAPRKGPPGFATQKTESSSLNNVPPGLKKKEESSGLQDSVLHVKKSDFLPKPESAQERNAALVGLIRSLISEKDFGKFRELSGSFRKSEINATEYYEVIRELFGSNLDLVFNELVDLLPDKEKQNELLKMHLGLHMFPVVAWGEGKQNGTKVLAPEPKTAWKISEGLQNGKSSQKSTTQVQSGIKKKRDKDFIVCKECGVPLTRKEVDHHMMTHGDSDFPALPSFSKANRKPTWNQRSVPVVQNSWAKLT